MTKKVRIVMLELEEEFQGKIKWKWDFLLR